MRVLIVEGNGVFGELVAQSFKKSGIDSDIVPNAGRAERVLADVEYEAIVLDLGLPDRDGLDLLCALRARGVSTSIIVTTARHGLEDRLRALREGADDYLAKPFSIDELIARLQAVLRRPRDLGGATLRAGNVALDMESRLVRVQGKVLDARLREALVLELLMRRVGRVVRRRYFFDRLFGLDGEQSSGTLDVHVYRLRRRLAGAGAAVEIHTIRGLGYILVNRAGEREPNTRDAHCTQ